jgi:hypothetical protein
MRNVLTRIGPAAALLGWAIAFAIALFVVGPIVADGFATLGRPHVG